MPAPIRRYARPANASGISRRSACGRSATWRSRLVHEEDWASAWKEHFPVLRVGRAVVIRPTWREHVAAPGEVVIALDPGMAFGTGLHPTTRLCLAGLERWADEGLVDGATVLDVGTGSGDPRGRGRAAGRPLGPRRGPRPDRGRGAARECPRNDVRIDVTRGSLPVDGGPFDLVLANLVAGLLVDLAVELSAAIRPGDGRPGSGGRLLASGIHVDREPEVRRAFAAAGLRILDRTEETEWVALDVERPGP